jgi:hypothetical protein
MGTMRMAGSLAASRTNDTSPRSLSYLDLVHPNDPVIIIPPANGGTQGIGILHKLARRGVATVMHLVKQVMTHNEVLI